VTIANALQLETVWRRAISSVLFFC